MANHWREEKFDWEIDSISFKLADRLVSHHAFSAGSILDFPKDHSDERRQFDKVYQWVLNTVEWRREIRIIDGEFSINKDAPPEVRISNVENKGSTPMTQTFKSEEGLTVKDSSTFTFEEKLHLGTKATAKAEIPFVGEAGLEISADLNINLGQKFERTESHTVTYGNAWSFDIPPRTKNFFVFTIMKTISSGKVKMIATPYFTEANPPVLNMNYGNVYVKMDEVSEREKTFEAIATFEGGKSTQIQITRSEEALPESLAHIPMSDIGEFKILPQLIGRM